MLHQGFHCISLLLTFSSCAGWWTLHCWSLSGHCWSRQGTFAWSHCGPICKTTNISHHLTRKKKNEKRKKKKKKASRNTGTGEADKYGSQTHEMFTRVLFIRTKHNMKMFWVIRSVKPQNDIQWLNGKKMKHWDTYLLLELPWYNRTGWLGVKHQLTYWYDRTGWLGVKHQLTYLLTDMTVPVDWV